MEEENGVWFESLDEGAKEYIKNMERVKRIPGATRPLRAAVLRSTQDCIYNYMYTAKVNGELHNVCLPKVRFDVFGKKGARRASNRGLNLPQIKFVNQDIVERAKEIADGHQSDRVALLDPASSCKAGGGAYWGAGALEEHLCRASDLYPRLQCLKYPLRKAVALLEVRFFRDTEANGYNFLPNYTTLGVIVAAALNGHRDGVLERTGEMTSTARADMQQRGFDLVAVAEANFDHVVLTAWGCGAFQLPAEEVATMLRRALQGSTLRSVTFAIIRDHNSFNKDLLDAFQSAFSV